MEFKGTKGKWKAKIVFDNWVIVDEKDNILGIRDNKENSKLIAAAPDLLEALECCLDSLGGEFNLPIDCISDAKQAIDKATK